MGVSELLSKKPSRFLLLAIIVSFALAVAADLASDYLSEQRLLMNSVVGVELFTRWYEHLAPPARAKVDAELRALGNSSGADIVNGTTGLSAKVVEKLNEEYSLQLPYRPSISEAFVVYAQQNWVRFLAFWAISTAVVSLIGAILAIRPCLFHCPTEKVRSVVAVTLTELLEGDAESAKRLLSPNQALVDGAMKRSLIEFLTASQCVGLALIRSNCTFGDYARVAIALDNAAHVSIKSTNLSLPAELFTAEYKTQVIRHLEAVNAIASTRNGVTVARRQVHVNEARKDSFQRAMISPSTEKQEYEQHFIATGVDYREVVADVDLPWNDCYGDYLVYDDKLVLTYDPESRVLTFLVGNEAVECYSKAFAI